MLPGESVAILSRRRTWDRPSCNNSHGWAIHCDQKAFPSCVLGGNMCLPVSASVNSLHYSGRDQRAVCQGEESFPVRHGRYDDSFHSNALMWFLRKHGVWKMLYWEAGVCGEDKKKWHKPFQKRKRNLNWLKFQSGRPNSTSHYPQLSLGRTRSLLLDTESRCF